MIAITPTPFAVDVTTPISRLELGQRVRARVTIYDQPGEEDQGPIHAEPGELGTVVFVDAGCPPTVRFDRTGTATMLEDCEVEVVLPN